MSLKERVVIVTGGGRGIGQAIAYELADQGCQVVLCGRNQESLDQTVGVIQEQGGRAAGVAADVTNEADVERVIAGAVEVFGPPTLLVNNAGNFIYRPLVDTTLDDWRQSLDVCLTASFLFIRGVVPHMRAAGGGRIVNISSLFATQPHTKNLSSYCAAKAGIIGLTQQLAYELRPDRITVNAVCPGAVQKDDAELEKQRYGFGEHLLRRDVAEPIGFLLSEKASQISGTIVEIPGGTGFETKVHAM